MYTSEHFFFQQHTMSQKNHCCCSFAPPFLGNVERHFQKRINTCKINGKKNINCLQWIKKSLHETLAVVSLSFFYMTISLIQRDIRNNLPHYLVSFASIALMWVVVKSTISLLSLLKLISMCLSTNCVWGELAVMVSSQMLFYSSLFPLNNVQQPASRSQMH